MKYLLFTSAATLTLVYYFGGLTLVSASFTLGLFLTVYLLGRAKRGILENLKYPIIALNFLSLPIIFSFPGSEKGLTPKFVEFFSVASPLLLVSSFELGRKRERKELISLILVFGASFANLTLLGSVQLIFILLLASFIYFFISLKTPFALSALVSSLITLYLLRMKGIDLRVENSSFGEASRVIVLTLLFIYFSLAFLSFVREKRDDFLGRCAFFISLFLILDLMLLFLFSVSGGLHTKPYVVFGLLCLSTASMVRGGMESG